MSECTRGKRHTWVFVKNVTRVNNSGSRVTISSRGKYTCECGQEKLGPTKRTTNLVD